MLASLEPFPSFGPHAGPFCSATSLFCPENHDHYNYCMLRHNSTGARALWKLLEMRLDIEAIVETRPKL